MIVGNDQKLGIIFADDDAGTAAFCLLGDGFPAVAVTKHIKIILHLLYRLIRYGNDRRHDGFCDIGNIQAAFRIGSAGKGSGFHKACGGALCGRGVGILRCSVVTGYIIYPLKGSGSHSAEQRCT